MVRDVVRVHACVVLVTSTTKVILDENVLRHCQPPSVKPLRSRAEGTVELSIILRPARETTMNHPESAIVSLWVLKPKPEGDGRAGQCRTSFISYNLSSGKDCFSGSWCLLSAKKCRENKRRLRSRCKKHQEKWFALSKKCFHLVTSGLPGHRCIILRSLSHKTIRIHYMFMLFNVAMWGAWRTEELCDQRLQLQDRRLVLTKRSGDNSRKWKCKILTNKIRFSDASAAACTSLASANSSCWKWQIDFIQTNKKMQHMKQLSPPKWSSALRLEIGSIVNVPLILCAALPPPEGL